MTPGVEPGRAAYDEEYYRATYGADLSRRLPRLTREQYWARWLGRRVDRRLPIVDLGAGLGWLARAVRGQGLEAITVDVSEFGARRLRLEQHLDVIVGSATSLPVRTHTASAIVALDVLEHVDDPARALEEARRAVADGGYLVLSVPNLEGTGARRKRDHGSWFGDRDETHASLLEPEVWADHVAHAGFEIVRQGSDFWWDVPYPGPVPAAVQRAVLIPLHRVVSRARGALHWTRGENLVLVGRAT